MANWGHPFVGRVRNLLSELVLCAVFLPEESLCRAAFDGVFSALYLATLGEGRMSPDAFAEDFPRGWSAFTDRVRRCGSAAVPGQGPFAVCYRWKSTFTEVETSPGSIQPRGKITVS
jgi:hypothetical protein